MFTKDVVQPRNLLSRNIIISLPVEQTVLNDKLTQPAGWQ